MQGSDDSIIIRFSVMVLKIQIVRYLDGHFPGWVECEFLDAENHRHTLVERVRVISTQWFGPGASYPQAGGVACEILARWQDASGRDLVRVTTDIPYSIESAEGVTEFVVLSSQVASAEATIADLETKARECEHEYEERSKTKPDRIAAALRHNAQEYREWIAALKNGHWRS
jgi:hypothetical protein